MFHVPAFDGSIVHWAILIYLCSAPALGIGEATGWTSFGYSKFADRKARLALPSRIGMFVIYLPAVFTFWIAPVVRGVNFSPWLVASGLMISFHFAKRCVEVLTLHRYSGVMNFMTTVMIGFLYTSLALILGEVAATGFGPEASPTPTPAMAVGLPLWVVGVYGNLHYHRLLAKLREPGETEYKVPRGGLFAHVACPHYLYELIGWWGFCLFFHHVGAAMMITVMTCYLVGRSHNTLAWYRERLGAKLPPHWKRLVPFVY